MGGKSSSPPPAPNPVDTATAQLNAQLATAPKAAQLQYDILNNPQYGVLPTTQLYENVRQQVYPNETAARNQLTQNIMAQLQSPNGITPDQQSSIDSARNLAQNQLIQSMRDRANLGGGLYGGRSAASEAQSVGQLQNQFVESDLARQERTRLQSQQSAFSLLQMLYPNSGIQDRKSTRLNSSHIQKSRMPSSA